MEVLGATQGAASGDEMVVINYNRFTGQIRDAGRYWDGVLVTTTSDIEEIKEWLV